MKATEDKNKSYVEINGKKPATISWEYPDLSDIGKQSYIEINLSHVRVSDGFRIKYDGERDGWIILQGAYIDHQHYCEPLNDYKEVAFIKSWNRTIMAEDPK